MSRQQYWLKSEKQWITLAEEPFAGGGEGNLYRIVHPQQWQRYVAKIYHPHKITTERERKINYLLHYTPDMQGQNEGGHPSVTWVKDALYQNDAFKGFLMPYTQGEKLEILTTPKIPRKHRQVWRRFDRAHSEEALRLRQLLGFNICIAIQQVHALGRYVLVDMKPDNIIVQPNGLVSVVDTDSVEVVEAGQTLFDAPVATPEYSPPEHYAQLDHDPTQRQAWDRFGLGVILYKLFFGIHPFAASAAAPYDGLTTLQDKIKHGLFVHAPEHQQAFTVIPPPHQQFEQLDPSLQALFLRCFVDGHNDPEARPTAEEWCAGILLATKDEALYERYRYVLSGESLEQQARHFPLPSYGLALPEPTPQLQALLEMTKPLNVDPPDLTVQNRWLDDVDFDAKDLGKRKKLIVLIILSVVFTVSVIGAFFVPFIWLMAINKLHKSYQESRAYREKKRQERKMEEAKKKAKSRIKGIHKQQRRVQRSMGKIGKEVQEVAQKIKAEYESIKAYLQQQDQAVRALNQKIGDQHQQLQEQYLRQAQNHRSIARVDTDQYRSLAQLKAAITQQNQAAVQDLKRIKIQDPKDEAFQDARLEIESLLQDKKEEVQQDITTQIKKLEEEERHQIKQLWSNYERQAELLRNISRLWKGIDLNKVLQQRFRDLFKELEVRYITDIKEVDVQERYIRLPNGEKLDMSRFPYSKDVLRNMAHWLDELKHRGRSLREQEAALRTQYQQQRRAVEDSQRIALDGLERVRQQQLQKVLLAVPNEQLGEPYQQLQQQYTQAVDYVEELQAAFSKEQEGSLQAYEATYANILAESKAQVEQARLRLIQLESRLEGFTQRLKRNRAHEEYKRLKREVDAARSEWARVQGYAERLEQYRNINFKHYLESVLKGK